GRSIPYTFLPTKAEISNSLVILFTCLTDRPIFMAEIGEHKPSYKLFTGLSIRPKIPISH
ncbi:MAG: hypothetical protein SPM04_10490, partial [Lachnospira sp.]|nr:hypothetical protein [Lachnospira sp.]